MEIRQLRAFVALAECLNYREAAAKLWLTQPTLTKQIKMLEAEAGLQLFQRDNQGTRLSRHGRLLYEDARQLLSSFNAFKTRCKQLGTGRNASLSIGFIGSATAIMPDIITRFSQRNPDIVIQLHDLSSPRQQQLILSGQLQAGFMRLPVASPLTFERTGQDCLCLIFHNHLSPEPAGLGHLLTVTTLYVLDAEDCPGSARQIENYISANGLSRQRLQGIKDARTIMTLVESQMGVAILPRSAMTSRHPDVQCQRLSGAYADWDVGLVWNETIPDPHRDVFIREVIKLTAPAPASQGNGPDSAGYGFSGRPSQA